MPFTSMGRSQTSIVMRLGKLGVFKKTASTGLIASLTVLFLKDSLCEALYL